MIDRSIFLILLLYMLPVSAQHAEFKGWAATSRELSTRLAPRGEDLNLEKYIPAEGLEGLLGTWMSFGAEHVFRNGTPNPVNMLLWHVTLSGFAKDMGESCVRPRFRFHANFLTVLNEICRWPTESAKSEQVMLNFWFAIMGYNSPQTEFLAWREFFLTSAFKDKSASESVEAMTLAITMNPYFLLGR